MSLPPGDVLRWGLDETAPSEIDVGGGSAVPLLGWCFHVEAPIRELRFVIDGRATAAMAHSLPRPDVYRALGREEDPRGHAYASGFYAVLPLPGVREPTPHQILMQVELADGRRSECAIDHVVLRPGPERISTPAGARIAICMATYDPPRDLFSRQIESICNQTRPDWRCVISDDRSPPHSYDRMIALLDGDERFVVDRSPIRRGVYRNFERALGLAGSGAELIALADQDDWWRPEKLDELVGALAGGAQLAYSDCRVVSRDGELLSPSFFLRRRNNSSDLGRMLLANCVTGAASMFRFELVDDLLPFPPEVGRTFHDHWLAVVALASGSLAYVDRPLYDYVQHSSNALGHAVGNRLGGLTARGFDGVKDRGPWMLRNRSTYRDDLLRAVMFGWSLERRLGTRMKADKLRAVTRLTALECSSAARASLALRALGARRGASSTLGAERDVLSALGWRRVMSVAGRRGSRIGDPRVSSAVEPEHHTPPARVSVRRVGSLAEKTDPLALERSPDEPERVNVLVTEVDLERPVGAVADFDLALRLAQSGRRVRVVVCDKVGDIPDDWRARLRGQAGQNAVDERLEVADCAGRAVPLPVNSRDVFVATTCWTAHIASAATRELGRERFLYLIQAYEPLGYAAGSFAMACEEAYGFPHHALFSTEPLRAHFQARRLGVYATDIAAGQATSLCFDNPISDVDPPTIAALHGRATRRLLFDCGPEPDAYSSMFELGLTALVAAARAGWLRGWEVNGLGSTADETAIELVQGLDLVLVDRGDERSYAQLVRCHDVGISLMAAPQPSLVAFEMAAGGLCAVTNTYGVKDRGWLEELSSNLVVVEPTVTAITEGIRVALGRASDVTARVAGAALRWPRSWTDALDDALIAKIAGALDCC